MVSITAHVHIDVEDSCWQANCNSSKPNFCPKRVRIIQSRIFNTRLLVAIAVILTCFDAGKFILDYRDKCGKKKINSYMSMEEETSDDRRQEFVEDIWSILDTV